MPLYMEGGVSTWSVKGTMHKEEALHAKLEKNGQISELTINWHVGKKTELFRIFFQMKNIREKILTNT